MIVPSHDYMRTATVEPPEFHRGWDGAAYGIVGAWKRRPTTLGRFGRQADRIYDMAGRLGHLSDSALRERMSGFRERFRCHRVRDDAVVSEALAAIVEAAERRLGLRPYPVQIVGALAMDHGFLAEMATGEGKTLTACLPMILAAWTERPAHLVTVNDYLSDRDATEMGRLYAFCGVSAAAVTAPMDQRERYRNYQKDVVYVTSKELVADFLRDRLRLGKLEHPTRRLIAGMLPGGTIRPDEIVMRGLDTVIVDEADSVLIDEAVTPLIISRARDNETLREACRIASEIADTLEPGSDYQVDERYKEVRITDAGEARVLDAAAKLPGVWQGTLRREELVKQALTAREFYIRDKQYVVDDGRLTIVDEFTGRLMPNRSWRAGLHQAVEAKEGLDATLPTETLSRLSFQRFFRQFRRIGGMTGTASEAASEFWHIYGLPVLRVPTHRPMVRDTYPDRVFATRDEKFNAIVDEIAACHESGRPVLVGTRNVEASETLASLLRSRNLEFNLLNATHHSDEARIVAAAGQPGNITIATNMAGRGTDIKLGRGVGAMGGLHVIATERHEARRIDRQLFGRCARQGDPGSARAYISVDDELIKRFVPVWVRNGLETAVAADLPAASQMAHRVFRYAQKAAEKLAFRQRASVLRADEHLERSLGFAGPGS